MYILQRKNEHQWSESVKLIHLAKSTGQPSLSIFGPLCKFLRFQFHSVAFSFCLLISKVWIENFADLHSVRKQYEVKLKLTTCYTLFKTPWTFYFYFSQSKTSTNNQTSKYRSLSSVLNCPLCSVSSVLIDLNISFIYMLKINSL